MGKSKAKKKRTFKEFLASKDIKVSAKTYFVDAMGGMAQGLFASLLIGTILSTAGKYIGMIDVDFIQRLAHFISKAGSLASAVTGAARSIEGISMHPTMSLSSITTAGSGSLPCEEDTPVSSPKPGMTLLSVFMTLSACSEALLSCIYL